MISSRRIRFRWLPAGSSQGTMPRIAVQAVERRLNGRGRVLLRPSGTEPVVRVMVEGEDELMVLEQAGQLAQVVSAVAAG